MRSFEEQKAYRAGYQAGWEKGKRFQVIKVCPLKHQHETTRIIRIKTRNICPICKELSETITTLNRDIEDK